MSLPSDLSALSRGEVIALLQVHVFETNLLMRSLLLMGVPINVDTVDRTDAAYPDGRPEIIIQVGHVPR